MTIRTRLTLWYSTLLATVILVFGVSLFSLLNWAWYSQLQENMRFVADQVRQGIAYDEASGLMTQPALQRQLARIPFFAFAVQIWDRGGQLMARTGNLDLFTEPFDVASLDSPEAVTRDIWLAPDNNHVLVFTMPLYSPRGQHVGAMQILSPLSTLEAATDRLLRVMIGVGIVALVLSFMVGSVIAGQALQPIDTIAQIAKQITAAQDLDKRIPYEGPPDELGQLAATFNLTLERLDKLFKSQRRLVADVSHEMRTPLTTIQGNLDMIKRFGADAETIAIIESEVQRMARMVSDLLMLAQADAGRLPLRESIVDLNSLAVEVDRQVQYLAKTVEVRLDAGSAVRVRGDADRLKQLMLNLVTNAIKYTLTDGVVEFRVRQENGYAFIQVSDTGIGIPKEDIPYIFDRFYRVDKARARAMGGVGLGLSIARWIAEAHQGRIWVESEEGKGSTFTVQLPSADMPETPPSMRETQRNMPIIMRRPIPKRRSES